MKEQSAPGLKQTKIKIFSDVSWEPFKGEDGDGKDQHERWKEEIIYLFV